MRRKRGRPRKVVSHSGPSTSKRPRGRPRKVTDSTQSSRIPKPVGRPRLVPQFSVPANMVLSIYIAFDFSFMRDLIVDANTDAN
jgi:AT hook motif